MLVDGVRDVSRERALIQGGEGRLVVGAGNRLGRRPVEDEMRDRSTCWDMKRSKIDFPLRDVDVLKGRRI